MNIFIKKLQKYTINSTYIILLLSVIPATLISCIHIFFYGVSIFTLLQYAYLGIIGSGAYLLFIHSFKYINIGLATLITTFSILFSSLLNYIFLGETIPVYKRILLVLVFIVFALYVFTHYKNNNTNLVKGVIIVTCVSILYGFRYFISNYLAKEVGLSGLMIKNIALFGGSLFMIGLLAFQGVQGKKIVVQNTQKLLQYKYCIVFIILLILIEFISDSMFFQLYATNNGTVLTILTLFEIVFSFLLGYIIFKEENKLFDYILFAIMIILLVAFMF